jgi:hypothetical protein
MKIHLKSTAHIATLAIAALFVARVWISAPQLWPPWPEALSPFVVDAFALKSQEEVADFEFLYFWSLSFIAVALTWAISVRMRASLREAKNA